mgnify:CR=1 FL=1
MVENVINDILEDSNPTTSWAFRSQQSEAKRIGVTCQKQINRIPFNISLYPQIEEDYDYDVIVCVNLENITDNPIIKDFINCTDESENLLCITLLGDDGILLKEEKLNVGQTQYTELEFDLQGDQGDHFVIQVNYQASIIEETIHL